MQETCTQWKFWRKRHWKVGFKSQFQVFYDTWHRRVLSQWDFHTFEEPVFWMFWQVLRFRFYLLRITLDTKCEITSTAWSGTYSFLKCANFRCDVLPVFVHLFLKTKDGPSAIFRASSACSRSRNLTFIKSAFSFCRNVRQMFTLMFIALFFVPVRDRLRTKKERDILVDVQHPFIVKLHYGKLRSSLLRLFALDWLKCSYSSHPLTLLQFRAKPMITSIQHHLMESRKLFQHISS